MARYKYKYKRRQKRKPKGYVSKQWASSKKGATSQSRQIMSLQRQMNAVKLSVRSNVQWSQYQYKPNVITHTGGSVITGPTPVCIHLVGPSAVSGEHDGWRRIFNSDPTVGTNIKWQGRSCGIEYQLSLGNAAVAASPVTFTVFFVSLRPKVAQLTQQESNFMSNLVEGEHYVKNTMGSVQGSGMVFLNKSMFKIHHIDRGMVGAKPNFVSGSEEWTTDLSDNLHRRYVNLPYKHLLKGDGAGSSGQYWSSLTYKTVPQTSQLFMLVFPNNWGDQTVDIAVNALFTGRTTQ